MGGVFLSDPQIPKIFACGGPRKPRFRCFKAKIFRLRRAKKKTPFLGVLKQKFSACGGQIPWVLSVYECKKALLSFVKVSNRRAGAVPVVFTSIGTRVYYSQKYLSAVYARARCVLRG